jgi:hypothetical protein
VSDDGNNMIMEELPSSLRTEVSLIMNQDIIGKVPIFQSSSPGFINALVLHLKPQTYTPKEFIVKQGDMGSEVRAYSIVGWLLPLSAVFSFGKKLFI